MCNLAESNDLSILESQTERQLPALKILQSGSGIHIDADDFVRRVLGDLFDVHAARRGSHKGKSPRIAIQYQPEVNLTRDLQTHFPIHLMHRHPFGSAL